MTLAMLLLPWSTGLHEVVLAFSLAWSLFQLRTEAGRAALLARPWLAPTLALAGLFALSGLIPPDREIGRAHV